MILTRALAVSCCVAILLAGGVATAAEPYASIVIRAGKTESPNHALARQFAEAVAIAVNGAYTLDVQESQGSVQNVMDATKAQRNYLFTAGPDLIAGAQHGQKPFAPDRRYRDIRALFPMPALTLHWLVRQDADIAQLQDLAGKSFISGAKGSVAERLTTTTLQALGLERQVQIIDIDAAAAPAALKAKQVSGIALAGAYPLAAIRDLASGLPVRLIGLGPRELQKILAADETTIAELVPKGSYPGMEADVTTLALPAGVYTTARMREATAYAITKAFWSQKGALAARNPPWNAVSFATLGTLKVKLHPGAQRYYRERGVTVPRALR